jgi:hypothetical protein
LPEQKTRITIVDDTSRGAECFGDCGVDWSQSWVVNEARRRISERFGDHAEMEYVDLPAVIDSEAVRAMKVAIQGLPLPVLLANGRPRIAGKFDIRQIMDVIEANLEADL